MPTFTELVSSVTTFIADYAVFAAAGAAIGLLMFGLRRFIRAGR